MVSQEMFHCTGDYTSYCFKECYRLIDILKAMGSNIDCVIEFFFIFCVMLIFFHSFVIELFMLLLDILHCVVIEVGKSKIVFFHEFIYYNTTNPLSLCSSFDIVPDIILYHACDFYQRWLICKCLLLSN